MLVLIASLAMLAGVLLLFGSWRKRLRPGWLYNTAGWLAIAGALWAWTHTLGPEFGPAAGMLIMPILAWAVVAANRRVREPRGERLEPASLRLPRRAAVVRHLGRFTLVVPVAGLGSALFVVWLAWLFPWADSARLAFVILAIPVVWGLCAWWATTDRRLWRPGLAIMLVAILCAVALLG